MYIHPLRRVSRYHGSYQGCSLPLNQIPFNANPFEYADVIWQDSAVVICEYNVIMLRILLSQAPPETKSHCDWLHSSRR